MPLGGIATGGISLGGRGNLQDWQIYNRPDRGRRPNYVLPCLWVKGEGEPFATVLERELLPPFDLEPEGLGWRNAPGLPRLREARFLAQFPLARVEFEDQACPVKVILEAFSPFVPTDADLSGLPCAALYYELHNPGKREMEAVIALALENPVGAKGDRRNEIRTGPGLRGLSMTNASLAVHDRENGSFALAVLEENRAEVEALRTWTEARGWRVGPQRFWFDYFAPRGALGQESEPSTPVGTVALRQKIRPGESKRFRFLLAWHFPNRTPGGCGWESPKGQEDAPIGNHYCALHQDAWAALEFTSRRLPELEAQTRRFAQIMSEATLPDAVKDAASANLSTLVTNTCLRLRDGSFHGFEGYGNTAGMGFGTCKHVWNYEVATQFVFPALARSMRETSFGPALDERGHMELRSKLPLGGKHFPLAAADGQMGQIVKLYLDWRLTGDDGWLQERWPGAKRALMYAWIPGGWDANNDGVMEGAQHNTYDVEFFGPNPMCGVWYLAALKAAGEMARAMSDSSFAGECQRLWQQGSAFLDANLFNGEYYEQRVEGMPVDRIDPGTRWNQGSVDTSHPDFQVGPGCLIDQLVGQYMATLAGLGSMLKQENIVRALRSIMHYNSKATLEGYASVQRVYALEDEAALIVCSYPRGGRPTIPMPYYSEVMTGFEYQAAVLAMAFGLVDEGIRIFEHVRTRYDGVKRNPFDESEYGRSYARAMASWGAIPVLSGFDYDGRSKALTIAPKVKIEEFRSLWSIPGGWGEFTLRPDRLRLTPALGSINIRQLRLPWRSPATVRVHLGKVEAPVTVREDGLTTMQFQREVAVSPGSALEVSR